jgi:hypothetical protein
MLTMPTIIKMGWHALVLICTSGVYIACLNFLSLLVCLHFSGYTPATKKPILFSLSFGTFCYTFLSTSSLLNMLKILPRVHEPTLL